MNRFLPIVIALLTAFLVPSIVFIYSNGQDNAILEGVVREMKYTRESVDNLRDKSFVLGAGVTVNAKDIGRLNADSERLDKEVHRQGESLAILLEKLRAER